MPVHSYLVADSMAIADGLCIMLIIWICYQQHHASY